MNKIDISDNILDKDIIIYCDTLKYASFISGKTKNHTYRLSTDGEYVKLENSNVTIIGRLIDGKILIMKI